MSDLEVLQRLTRIETQFTELQKDVAHLEAWQENAARTMDSIAGLLRDHTAEHKLFSKVIHVTGYIIATTASLAGGYWFHHISK
jgi:hypothetical protein